MFLERLYAGCVAAALPILLYSNNAFGQTNLPDCERVLVLDTAKSKTSVVRVEADLSHEGSTVDFGLFLADESVSRKLTFENATRHVLTPVSAKPSCGCIIAKLPTDPIPAGQTVSLDLLLKAGAGDFLKSISISFKELSKPVVVQLKGTAKNRFSLSPNSVSLSVKKPRANVELSPAFGDSLKGVLCRSNGELVNIEVKESREEGLSLAVTASKPDDQFWRGINSTVIEIELLFPDRRIIPCSLCINSALGVSVFPRIVSLSNEKPTEVTVFRKEPVEPPKFLRFSIDGKLIAAGTFTSQAKGSALARYSVYSDVVTQKPQASAEAVVEESENRTVWREIGIVSVVFE